MSPYQRAFAALVLALWAAVAAAQTPAMTQLMPGSRDTCPVCGMLVAKYPNWVAAVQYRDGHAHFFDGAKDMFKYLFDLPKYAPHHSAADIKVLLVTEYYGLTRIDARKAYYVVGSDVLGPMGHELVPLATRADADEFTHDHHGRQILTFDQVTPTVVGEVDAGKF